MLGKVVILGVVEGDADVFLSIGGNVGEVVVVDTGAVVGVSVTIVET